VAGNIAGRAPGRRRDRSGYESNGALPFAERLLAALAAGDAAVATSAASRAPRLISRPRTIVPRSALDDHAEPMFELKRLTKRASIASSRFRVRPSKARRRASPIAEIEENREIPGDAESMSVLLGRSDLRTHFATEDASSPPSTA
jgi:hypothetical protein